MQHANGRRVIPNRKGIDQAIDFVDRVVLDAEQTTCGTANPETRVSGLGPGVSSIGSDTRTVAANIAGTAIASTNAGTRTTHSAARRCHQSCAQNK